MDSDEPRYATSEEAEELARPAIKCVNVPETVKRRLPTKHYVSCLAKCVVGRGSPSELQCLFIVEQPAS